MVKNDRGGNKAKKQKRNFGKYDAVEKLEQGQMFAQITHNHGGAFSVLCSDGIVRLGKLSGFMKKGPRLSEGSFVIISLRDFESEQKHCDIISYGDPPSEVINIFKKNDPKSHKKADIEFVESDDEFKEFEESNKTVNINDTNKTNKNDVEKDLDWTDLL